MNKEQAKSLLLKFLGGREFTFSIKQYDNREWVAVCNEIPAIMTGGLGYNITDIDFMIRDAILTAAGIDTVYANDILKFTGYKNSKNSIASFLNLDNLVKNEAEYAIS
jgi:hypothetical protein